SQGLCIARVPAMARTPRIDVGGQYYHVLNRANDRKTIFSTPEDYDFFEKLLFQTLESTGVLCSAFVIMPNHWHLLLKTFEDGDLSHCLHILTQKHAQNVRARTGTTGNGHLYQNRYKSWVITDDTYF